MKNLHIIVFCFLILGCTENSQVNNPIKEKTDCKSYFDFDEIEYYQINISEDNAMKLYDSKNKIDQKLNDAVNQKLPDTITNIKMLLDLEKIGYKKSVIQKNKFEEIRSVFCERKHTESYAYACVAIFRDILVFKKSNKTVGVAEICFGCEQDWIIGTNRNTMDFGMSGDFDKLYNVLH
jgi:hypothetical protein